MTESDYLKLLVEEAPDALIDITAGGSVLYWSRGAEATFGYTARRRRPEACRMDWRPPDRNEGQRAFRQAVRRRGSSPR
jgi:PAS domain S-box-containing protein